MFIHIFFFISLVFSVVLKNISLSRRRPAWYGGRKPGHLSHSNHLALTWIRILVEFPCQWHPPVLMPMPLRCWRHWSRSNAFPGPSRQRVAMPCDTREGSRTVVKTPQGWWFSQPVGGDSTSCWWGCVCMVSSCVWSALLSLDGTEVISDVHHGVTLMYTTGSLV